MAYNIALVSYINTCPFTDGITQLIHPAIFNLNFFPPSECSRILLEEKAQMALIPVGSLPDFSNIHILPNYCIGSKGPVNSVFIFSQQPLENLDTVWLDPHSRTSNGLAQILCKYYWKVPVSFIQPANAHIEHISSNVGGVVIGDLALKEHYRFNYAYDLSEAWYNWTGLPFVFAVWAYYPDHISGGLLSEFSEALFHGVKNKVKSAEKWAEHFGFGIEEAKRYLNDSIDFHFTERRHISLELYLKALNSLKNQPILS